MMKLLGALLVPKIVESAWAYAEEAIDYVTGDEFTEADLINIKKSRLAVDVTDEHLAYELNVHFKRHISVVIYREIWNK
jgi:hypothetical protein